MAWWEFCVRLRLVGLSLSLASMTVSKPQGKNGSVKFWEWEACNGFSHPGFHLAFFVAVSILVTHNRLTKEGLLVVFFCVCSFSQFCSNMSVNLNASASQHVSVHCWALINFTIFGLFSFWCFCSLKSIMHFKLLIIYTLIR